MLVPLEPRLSRQSYPVFKHHLIKVIQFSSIEQSLIESLKGAGRVQQVAFKALLIR